MRLTMLSLFPIVAALLGETQASSAQSAHSYSWSSKSQSGGSVACRFSSSTGAIASKAPTPRGARQGGGSASARSF
jgi:hypothetical protein